LVFGNLLVKRLGHPPMVVFGNLLVKSLRTYQEQNA
jgi:hypothetical protein